jgi:membrane-bound serine protease (ClpP class)
MSAVVVVLLVTGASLLVAEAHVVSYGLLGLLGAIALAAGVGLALEAGGLGTALAVAIALVLAAGAATGTLLAARAASRFRRRRPLGGADGLVGRLGVVRRPLEPVGVVNVMGELWRARPSWMEGEPVLAEGEEVVVEEVRGLTLRVRRAEEWEVDL